MASIFTLPSDDALQAAYQLPGTNPPKRLFELPTKEYPQGKTHYLMPNDTQKREEATPDDKRARVRLGLHRYSWYDARAGGGHHRPRLAVRRARAVDPVHQLRPRADGPASRAAKAAGTGARGRAGAQAVRLGFRDPLPTGKEDPVVEATWWSRVPSWCSLSRWRPTICGAKLRKRSPRLRSNC